MHNFSFSATGMNPFTCFNCYMMIFCFVCLCRTQHSNFNSEGFWKTEGEWKVVEAGRELPFLLAEHDKIRHKVLFSVFFAGLFLLVWGYLMYICSIICCYSELVHNYRYL